MSTRVLRSSVLILALCATILVAMGGSPPNTQKAQPATPKGYSPEMQAKIRETQAKLRQMERDQAVVEKNLKTFDTLDFVVFTNQEWVRLHESHSKDVVVNWPDGHHTNGIQRHIADLKALFVYAPDTRIRLHAVRFGVYRGATRSSMDGGKIKRQSVDGGDGFTCVTGVMEGTFTKPMPIGGAKVIKPTGRKFSIPMCTVGHWKNGVMVEEWLYWDNATYMKQIGLAK